MSVKINAIVRESPEAVSIHLSTPDNYTFRPGQHMVVKAHVGEGAALLRQYSFASAPQSGELWITVVKTPEGEVSTWLTKKAAVGDTLEISQPFAGPLMQTLTRGDLCMIAGGSGIAPLMSMIRERRLSVDKSPLRLLYSTRSSSRCYRNELKPQSGETIVVHLSDKYGRTGRQEIQNITDGCSHLFICGSREFVQYVSSISKQLNPKLTVYSEAFSL